MADETELKGIPQRLIPVLRRLAKLVLDFVTAGKGLMAGTPDAIAQGGKDLERLYDDTVTLIEEEPLASTAVFFAVGCALGYFLMRKR